MTIFNIGLALVEFGCIASYVMWLQIKNKKAEKEFNKRWENYQ